MFDDSLSAYNYLRRFVQTIVTLPPGVGNQMARVKQREREREREGGEGARETLHTTHLCSYYG
jgi:hypothetical protein